MSEPEAPPTFEEILAYLRQHGSAYSRESLEQQLRRAGADFATIDRAFLAWEDEILAADSAGPPRRRPWAWPWSLALTAVFVLIFGLLTRAGFGELKSAADIHVGLLLLARRLAVGIWFGELILGLVLIKLSPRLSRILLLAVIWQFLLAVAAVLLVLGFCAWLFVQMAHGGH